MNAAAVTIDQMRDQIVQIIIDLDAIPPDQRTPAMERLLANLSDAIEKYESDEGETE